MSETNTRAPLEPSDIWEISRLVHPTPPEIAIMTTLENLNSFNQLQKINGSGALEAFIFLTHLAIIYPAKT